MFRSNSNKRFYLIDFESFSKSEVKVSTLYGTRGFFDNDYDMNDQTIDYFPELSN